MATLRNTPDQGGRGDGTALLAIYPISRNSQPGRDTKTRAPLDAVGDVIGIGLVFPKSRELEGVEYSYVMADTGALVVEEPGEEDQSDGEGDERPAE